MITHLTRLTLISISKSRLSRKTFLSFLILTFNFILRIISLDSQDEILQISVIHYLFIFCSLAQYVIISKANGSIRWCIVDISTFLAIACNQMPVFEVFSLCIILGLDFQFFSQYSSSQLSNFFQRSHFRSRLSINLLLLMSVAH